MPRFARQPRTRTPRQTAWGTPPRRPCPCRAGLDIFSGNDDLMLAVGLQPREFGDDEDEVLGWSEDDMGGGLTDPEASGAHVAQRLKRQLQSQAAIIAELEERNLTLEEKVWVLERELKELKALVRGEEEEGPGGEQAGDELEQDHEQERTAGGGGSGGSGGEHEGGSGEQGAGGRAEHAGSSSGVEDVDLGAGGRWRRREQRRREEVLPAEGQDGGAQGGGEAVEGGGGPQGPGEAHGGSEGPQPAPRPHDEAEVSSVSGQGGVLPGGGEDGASAVEQQQHGHGDPGGE